MSDTQYTLEIDGASRDVKMTYGLLDAVCRACGDAEGALTLNLDHDLREEVLNILLATRDSQGRITTPVNVMTMAADPEDIQNLLEWGGTHALDFFLKAAEKAKKTGEARADRLKALQST